MRENLGIFKGKRIDTGVWVQGNYLHLKGGPVDPDMHFIVTEDGQYNKCFPESVCEYTGVRDKNGVMLFENDIIKSNGSGTFKDYSLVYRAYIEYIDNAAGFFVISSGEVRRLIPDTEDRLLYYEYAGNKLDTQLAPPDEQISFSDLEV